jgi:serine/threonine protein kinase
VVKILDMGLTRSVADAADNLTAIHGALDDVAGTVDFISPEQALNQPVDIRSDIYSLGATFYALLTARPPFDGNTAQKLMQHQLKEPPRLSQLRSVLPSELVDIIAKMMAKKPAQRYRSAAEVIGALTPWLPHRNAGVRREAASAASAWASTRTRLKAGIAAARRSKWWVKAVAAGIVVTAVCGVALAVAASGKSTSTPTPATSR